jgi:protein-S-isoprenylcysteine O-methyltransferase Ste14
MPHGDRKSYQERDDLVGEHRLGDTGQLVLAVIFFGVWIADSFFFKYTTFVNDYIPLAVKIPLAIIIFVLSGYLAWQGMVTVFGKTRQTPGVIRTGVFGVVRHPIYLSEILLYLGFLVLSTPLAGVVIWIIVICFLHYISRHEEQLLLARFGDDYRQYMKDVPMWIPQPWRKKTG